MALCLLNQQIKRLMRILFLMACVAIGGVAGLWWTGLLPSSALSSASNPDAPPTTLSAISDDAPLQTNAPANETLADTPPQASVGVLQPIEEKVADASVTNRLLSYHDGIMRVAPAVVSVYASNAIDGQDATQTSQGSGVIVAADGIVLTNLHLIQNFNAITVVLNDGRTYPANLIGSDVETDLAVVRIEANMLPFVKLNEAAPLKVGDVVLAIGNPFGVGQTVTQGIVSATRRRVANASVWQNFVQIDAAINPGNSGGALINPLGQLVGVNTAVFRGDSGAIGIGFAIPADLLAQVVPQIIEHGSVSRGWLGLGVEEINMFPALTRLGQQGAVITMVQQDSPAFLTGVRPMDVVVQLGEQPITNATQLQLAVSALPPGTSVKLVLLRSPNPDALNEDRSTEPLVSMTYKVALGKRPSVSQLLPPARTQ